MRQSLIRQAAWSAGVTAAAGAPSSLGASINSGEAGTEAGAGSCGAGRDVPGRCRGRGARSGRFSERTAARRLEPACCRARRAGLAVTARRSVPGGAARRVAAGRRARAGALAGLFAAVAAAARFARRPGLRFSFEAESSFWARRARFHRVQLSTEFVNNRVDRRFRSTQTPSPGKGLRHGARDFAKRDLSPVALSIVAVTRLRPAFLLRYKAASAILSTRSASRRSPPGTRSSPHSSKLAVTFMVLPSFVYGG